MIDALTLLVLLLFWHCLADYPLQGDFLAKAKNPAAPIPGVPWTLALASYAMIHAGGVLWLTGSLWLALAEFVGHCLIDLAKCRGRITFAADQALHVAMKLVYVALIAVG